MSWTEPQHAFRTFFSCARHRDILATTPEGAQRAAVQWEKFFDANWARRVKGRKRTLIIATHTVDLGHRGSDAADCRICRQPKLF